MPPPRMGGGGPLAVSRARSPTRSQCRLAKIPSQRISGSRDELMPVDAGEVALYIPKLTKADPRQNRDRHNR
jgi:hypothetical protein